MTIVGPCVLDVVQHFIERWNEIKKRKVCQVFIQMRDFTHLGGTVRSGRVSMLILPVARGLITYIQTL